MGTLSISKLLSSSSIPNQVGNDEKSDPIFAIQPINRNWAGHGYCHNKTIMSRNRFLLSLDVGRWRRPLSTLAIEGTTTSRLLQGRRRRCASDICTRQSSIATSTSTATEEETIEAVFVFHRHGDRTPGKPLVEEKFEEEESAFWRTKIPPFSYHKVLCERFPVVRSKRDDASGDRNDSSNNSTSFLDASGGNESYGFLTWKGMHQMYHNGVSMAHRYGPQTTTTSFQDYWDIQAVSTNYLRTVMSCQTFLDGLLAKNNSSNTVHGDNEAPLDYDCPTHYERISPDEHRSKRTINHNDIVEIVVRDPEQHETTLNAFETSPKLMKKLVGDVFATPEFIATDRQARSLALELSEYYLLGLSKHSSYASSPSGGISINWVRFLFLLFVFAVSRKRERERIRLCVSCRVYSGHVYFFEVTQPNSRTKRSIDRLVRSYILFRSTPPITLCVGRRIPSPW